MSAKKNKIFKIFIVLLLLTALCSPILLHRASAAEERFLGDVLGVTREQIVQELTKHENDNFYLGTPYTVGWPLEDNVHPNGIPRSDGYVGMNCTGFVVRTIWQCGGDTSIIRNYNSGTAHGYLMQESSAKAWEDLMKDQGLVYYTYSSPQELLQAGKARKGDIIYCWPVGGWAQGDTHIGFFWGDTPSDNKFWHSDHLGNRISALTPKSDPSVWYLFKVNKDSVPVTLTKTTNASAQYQAKHTLIGSEFTVYTDQACTQVAKDENGNNAIITITNQGNTGNINLPPGTYWIKETKPTKGYKLNTTSKKIDITNGQPITLEFENYAAFSNLQIKKTIVGNYSVSGTTFVLYEDQACTKPAKDSNNNSINMSVNDYGLTDTVELEEGTYYIKEKSTSSYYNLKQNALKVTLTADSTKVQDFVNELKPGKGKVKKTF